MAIPVDVSGEDVARVRRPARRAVAMITTASAKDCFAACNLGSRMPGLGRERYLDRLNC